MSHQENIKPENSKWKGMFKAGGIATVAMLAIMAVQIIIFAAWPPPDSVEELLKLFTENWLLGLLSMDLLYIANNALLILVYLALYFALRKIDRSLMAIGLALGLTGIAAYFASNTAFEMLSLSRQYAAAAAADKVQYLAAGHALFAIYQGTAFNVYYVLNAAALLMFAAVMLKSSVFPKATAYFGLLAGVLMIIPSTAGAIGLVFSLASLIPWAVFSVGIAKKFFHMASESHTG